MSFPWNRNPLIRVAIPFVFGVNSGPGFRSEWPDVGLYLGLTTIALLLLLNHSAMRQWGQSQGGFLIQFTLFCFGASVAQENLRDSETLMTQKSDYMIGEVMDTLHSSPWANKAIVRWWNLDATFKDDTPDSGPTLLTITKKSKPWSPGQRFIAKVNFKIPAKARFYGEFDETRFLKSKGILLKTSTSEKDLIEISPNATPPGVITEAITIARCQISRVISTYLKNPAHQGICKALILGDRSEIPKQTMTKLAGAGIAHVLAVSGLHVGIIFLLLNQIRHLFPGSRARKYLVPLILITGMVMYALLTGSSPSVVRAVLMLSLYLITKMAGLRVPAINVVLLAGLIILLAKPLLVHHLGFQLSFIAVLGILWLYPALRKLFYVKSRVGKMILDVAYVSIAAQIVTSPLTVSTFQFFPTYFLIANLLLAPILILCLYLSLMMILAGAFEWETVTQIISSLIEFIMGTFTTILDVMSTLPLFKMDQLYLPWEYAIPVLILIGSSIGFLMYRRSGLLVTAMLILTVMICVELQTMRNNSHRKQWVNLSQSGRSIWVLQKGRSALLVTHDTSSSVSPGLDTDLKMFMQHHRIFQVRKYHQNRCAHGPALEE